MSDERFQQLMDQAEDLPEHSPLRLPLLEEAVREADRLADEELAYEARSQLVEVATFNGCEDRALVAFGWCLAYADRLGDDFHDDYTLLWQYKWMADNVSSFPAVSREQVTSMAADFQRRLESNGHGLRPVHKIHWSNATAMGDLDRLPELFETWQESSADMLSDCRACDADSVVTHWACLGDAERAITAATPILEGALSCSCVPHVTLATILRPLAELGRFDEADAHQQRGYRLVSRDRNHLADVGDHLEYLALRQAWTRGVRMVERHLAWTIESTNPSHQFDFDLGAWMLLARLAEERDNPRKLRTPAGFPLASEDDRYRPSDLAAWFEERTRRTGRRFDERNGNDFHARLIDDAIAYTRGTP